MPTSSRLPAVALIASAALLVGACASDDTSTAVPISTMPGTSAASTPATIPSPRDTTVAPTPPQPTSGGAPVSDAPVPSTSDVVSPSAVQLAPASAGAVVVEAPDEAALAIATSRALFVSAPVVVLTATSAPDAASAAETLGVPLLSFNDTNVADVAEEVARLGARWVIAPGGGSAELEAALSPEVVVVAGIDDLPAVTKGAPAAGVAVLVPRDHVASPAAVTARAAGLPVVPVDGGDPRTAPDSGDALRAVAPSSVIAIGAAGTFPTAEVLAGLVGTVLAGHELPGDGQVLFPGRRLVALYGHPGDDNLGVLGEQSASASVERARDVAAAYDLGGEPAIPTFEIIATVASSEAGDDGDYSLESTIDHLRPWVDAAAAAGIYVVLELQPGHTDFLTQAKLYEELLVHPHVGLGLDPEWRLAPGERHMEDIGQVSAAEVNAVATWLAELTRRHALPQKMLLLQQFRLDMLPDRENIAMHPELAVVVQMDGFGSQDEKLETWGALTRGGPEGILFGWKQFYDEDETVRSPQDTIDLQPSPVFISFQ